VKGAIIVNVLSVRYSVNRKKEYQIKTIIFEENGRLYVRKEPYTLHAADHIKKMIENYQLFIHSSMQLLAPRLDGDLVVFPFIEGESLDSKLLLDVKNGDVEQFSNKILWFKSLLDMEEKIDFFVTPQFSTIFGNEYNFTDCKSLLHSNIDLNFDNLIIDEQSNVTVIDYEWIYHFPIPVNFIFYRSINSFLSKYELPENFQVVLEELFNKMGITTEVLINFNKMEEKFTTYIGHHSMFYSNYLKDLHELNGDNVEQLLVNSVNGYLQVFWSINGEFSEKQSIKTNLLEEFHEQTIEIELPSKEISMLRIDPMTFIGVMDIQADLILGERQVNLLEGIISTLDCAVINSNKANEKTIISGSVDPQLFMTNSLLGEQGIKKIRITLTYCHKVESKLSQTFNIHNKVIRDLGYEVDAYKKLNDDLNLKINNYFNEVNKYKDIIDSQNAIVNEKDELLSIKEETIKTYEKIIVEKEQRIKKQEEVVSEQKQVIKQRDEIIREKEQFIERVVTSRTWRLLKKLRLIKF